MADQAPDFSALPEIQPLTQGPFKTLSAELDCLRLDKVHPFVSGNKWYKLAGHINAFKASEKKQLLSFGGAYSNHLHALAYTGDKLGIPTIGLVRGEAPEALTPTLSDCERWGMRLHWIPRQQYRETATSGRTPGLSKRFPDAWVVPEGGEGALGVEGVRELFTNIDQQAACDYDFVACSVGSGTTLAGIISAVPERTSCIGFSALKNAHDLEQRVAQQLHGVQGGRRWKISHEYHFGGFAKMNPRLAGFISEVQAACDLLLDPVYTGKALFGLVEWLIQKRLPENSRVLFVHTGGLQGWRGFADSRPVVRQQK